MKRGIATFVVLAVLGGCAPEGGCRPSDDAAAKTDPVRSLLLSEDEVVAILGVEDLGSRDLTDEPVARNPDPRGPCGAVVVPPDLEKARKLAFVGVDLFVVEIVLETSDESVAYLEALLADATAGCPDFTSTTASGATQTFSGIAIASSGLAERIVAWTSRVDLDSKTAYVGAGAFDANGYTVVLQVESDNPVAIGQMQAIVRAAFDRVVAADQA